MIDMETNDGRSLDDKHRIHALVDFILQQTPNLNYGKYISSGKDFMKLVELVSNLPNRGIYFKLFEFVDGITRPIGYFRSDGLVSYLFEKIELYQWSISVLQYYYHALGKIDLVYVIVQPLV